MTGPNPAPGDGGHHEQAMFDILARLRNRFFGKYRGVVIDADAPTMRVKASVPDVLGAQTSGWARPCVPYAGPGTGFAFLPDIGTGIWIEFEAGDVSFPIWTGCYWHDGEQPPDATSSVLAIVTKAKQKILIDTGGTITVSDANNNSITLDASGITIQGGGQSLALGSSGVNVNNGALQVTP